MVSSPELKQGKGHGGEHAETWPPGGSHQIPFHPDSDADRGITMQRSV